MYNPAERKGEGHTALHAQPKTRRIPDSKAVLENQVYQNGPVMQETPVHLQDRASFPRVQNKACTAGLQ
ncbi:MAG: hypothetical protein CEE38_16335 [Planctomycetes bacterium B3_Pla]|nr:MAG: hypothetical protein CEE38_16335 [Planctomycetes bacterium B3_Pla]